MSHYHNADGKPEKAGQLPDGKGIEDIDSSVRPIIIDRHLTRDHLITRIIDATGIDRKDGSSTNVLNHDEMIRLYQASTDDQRDERTIRQDMDKQETKGAIADAYGIRDDVDMGKRKFDKMGLITLLVAIVTDDYQHRVGLLETPTQTPTTTVDTTNDI